MARRNKKSQRSFKKVDLFIVDGPTEKWYLEDLFKLYIPKNKIKFLPDLSGSWKKNIKSIKDHIKEFENIYWIVDMDVILKEESERKKNAKSPLAYFIKEYKILSKKTNIHIFVNTPCFEFWILLHFKFTTFSSVECREIVNRLTKITELDNYDKTEKYYKNKRINLVERLNNYLPVAIENAKKLGDFDIENPAKPIPEIYKLFKEYF
jgi:hypothetical protein